MSTRVTGSVSRPGHLARHELDAAADHARGLVPPAAQAAREDALHGPAHHDGPTPAHDGRHDGEGDARRAASREEGPAVVVRLAGCNDVKGAGQR